MADYLDHIKHHRIMRGYTQADVGKVLNMTYKAYGLIERGLRNVKLTDAMRLAKFYNISLDELVGFGEYDTGGKLYGMARK